MGNLAKFNDLETRMRGAEGEVWGQGPLICHKPVGGKGGRGEKIKEGESPVEGLSLQTITLKGGAVLGSSRIGAVRENEQESP